MKKLPLKLLSLTLAAAVVFTAPAYAETPEEKGFAIAAKSDRSDRGFGDSNVKLKMDLHNAHGQKSGRTLIMKTLEDANEEVGDKSIVLFDEPADIKGTALLSHARILKADDQWLYLPALKRIKRISSVNKSGPFVGSEFAFEDFTSQELNKFSYKYLRTEPCPVATELTCDVVERYPRYEHSGYTRQIAWFDQKHSQQRRVDFYDRKDDLLKTLEFQDYKIYKDKYWRPLTMTMKNHLTGKSTVLSYSNYEFSVGLRDKDFVKGVLKRVR